MNNHHHFVPYFDTNVDHVTHFFVKSSKKTHQVSEEEDDLLELLWRNSQVVLHNQRPTPTSAVKLHNGGGEAPPLDHYLFIQEDEVSSWLHYPLCDHSSPLIFSSPPHRRWKDRPLIRSLPLNHWHSGNIVCEATGTELHELLEAERGF
ncbi:unnamed protein product [Eruca vesicaria subsp. sativa]|uniref:Uncharacterized protein n=1 Tax=Eruca vesicaria subsp. sativa TaxID=29727 RepID=A0ABC8L9M5_ERUVS|nr:unnamed protein product [Eruca vesicaria subsp. sativa]